MQKLFLKIIRQIAKPVKVLDPKNVKVAAKKIPKNFPIKLFCIMCRLPIQTFTYRQNSQRFTYIAVSTDDTALLLTIAGKAAVEADILTAKRISGRIVKVNKDFQQTFP